MKTLLTHMVGVATAGLMLYAHADFIDDSQDDATLLDRDLHKKGREEVHVNVDGPHVRDGSRRCENK